MSRHNQEILCFCYKAAQLMRWLDGVETIQAGKLADLVVVEGDPTAEMMELDVKFVMKGGPVFKNEVQ